MEIPVHIKHASQHKTLKVDKYRARTSNCRPLWVTLDPNVVIIRIFSKFPRKDTDNTRSLCLI